MSKENEFLAHFEVLIAFHVPSENPQRILARLVKHVTFAKYSDHVEIIFRRACPGDSSCYYWDMTLHPKDWHAITYSIRGAGKNTKVHRTFDKTFSSGQWIFFKLPSSPETVKHYKSCEDYLIQQLDKPYKYSSLLKYAFPCCCGCCINNMDREAGNMERTDLLDDQEHESASAHTCMSLITGALMAAKVIAIPEDKKDINDKEYWTPDTLYQYFNNQKMPVVTLKQYLSTLH